VELVLTLGEIEEDGSFASDIRCQAKGYLENLCKYETISCAQLFLRIFEKTTPFSKYLQTKGIDLLKVFELYEETVASLKEFYSDFESIQTASQNFVEWANQNLELNESDIIIDDKLPEKRRRRVKKMFDYEADDDTVNFTPEQSFKFDVYNVVIDKIVNCMEDGFKEHGLLCADFSCLDPKNFDEITKNLPKAALEEVHSIITACTPDFKLSLKDLQLELKDFSAKWKSMKRDGRTFYEEQSRTTFADEGEEFEDENEFEEQENICAIGEKKTGMHNKFCINCVYKLLQQYNLYSRAYPGLTMAYKLLLTLSVTQVSFERCFSKLKIIKNRL